MAAKTVALDEEAYKLLKRQKRANETFSDAVKRLARPRVPLTAFAGAWADLSKKERRGLDLVYAAYRDADRRRLDRIRRHWSTK
jgi:predicted CopG family antitoxin